MEEFKVYHSPGKILKSIYGQFRYVDQLSKEYREFTSYSAEKYLLETYNLKIYEYYNIIVYGEKDKVLLCPHCGRNSMRFKGLTKGWSIYCNQSCITTHRLINESRNGINPFQDKDFIEKNRVRSSEFQSSQMRNRTSPLLRKSSKFLAARNNFILNHVNDICILYVCSVMNMSDKYKIGICSTNIKSRLYYKSCKLFNHHVLYKGPAQDVADLEIMIKLTICENESEFISSSKLKDLLNIVRSY